MANLIDKLFHRCKHEWKTFETREVHIYDAFHERYPVEYKYIELQRCEKCGKIRKQTIKW